MYEAVRAGALDGMNAAPIYWTGKDAAFSALGGLPFSFEEIWQFDAWFHQRGGLEMLRELYAEHDMFCVGIQWHSHIESLSSKVPIHTLEDFKGLKMRSPGGMSADIFGAFGTSLIVLPGEEIYSALEKGVIDMADWGTPALNFEFGLHEVTTYFTWPGFHHAPLATVDVRMDRWNELPDDIKAMLKVTMREWNWDNIQYTKLADLEAIRIMIEEYGNVPIAWEEAEIARLRAIAVEIWDEWAAKSPMAYRAIESQKDFMRELGLLE